MDKELQALILLIQLELKILKELRLLNKNFENSRRGNGQYATDLIGHDLEDVKEAIAATGKTFI